MTGFTKYRSLLCTRSGVFNPASAGPANLALVLIKHTSLGVGARLQESHASGAGLDSAVSGDLKD